jgi:RsiW-degrading membrane proteinase PrsW (M82 family)
MDLIIQLIIAIAPGLGVAVFIYIKDRYDPEPIRTLVSTFIFGIIAFLLTIGISSLFEGHIEIKPDDVDMLVFKAFFLVALIEEACKFIFIRGVIYKNKEFDEPIDGIIYAVMVGMGFATAENLLYVFYAHGGGETGIVRMFTAIPAHAFFAIFMGFFVGRAKFAPRVVSHLFSTFGLIVAVLFHGLYDSFLFLSFIPGIWIWSFVTLFVAFLISGKLIQLLQRTSPFKSNQNPKDKS